MPPGQSQTTGHFQKIHYFIGSWLRHGSRMKAVGILKIGFNPTINRPTTNRIAAQGSTQDFVAESAKHGLDTDSQIFYGSLYKRSLLPKGYCIAI